MHRDNERAAEAGTPRANAWPLVGAAIIVGAAVGAAWFAVRTPVQPRIVEAALAPAEVIASAPALSGDIAQILGKEEPASAEPPAPVEQAADQALVCGEPVSREALRDSDLAAAMLQQAESTRALDSFARQELGSDEHARAVGLVLRMQADLTRPADEAPAADCRDDACWREGARAHAERVAPLLGELATLAAGTSDPRVMVLARDECELLGAQAEAPPHCQALTARRWIAIEPDNAAAWLALAVEEPAAADEAMYQASIAPRWDDYATAARRFIERVDPQGGLRSWAVLNALMAIPASQSITGPQNLLQHCSTPRVATDANRRQVCERIAQGLHDRSTSLMGLNVAALVAKSLGRAEADRWREEQRLLSHVADVRGADAQAQEADAGECSIGAPRGLLLRSSVDGEVSMLRALMAQSGLSVDDWRASLAAEDAAAAARKVAQSASAAAQGAAQAVATP